MNTTHQFQYVDLEAFQMLTYNMIYRLSWTEKRYIEHIHKEIGENIFAAAELNL